MKDKMANLQQTTCCFFSTHLYSSHKNTMDRESITDVWTQTDQEVPSPRTHKHEDDFPTLSQGQQPYLILGYL